MSKGIIETIAGAYEITAGIALEFIAPGNPLSTYLIVSGAGMLVAGIGTMLSKGPVEGFATATRNPVAPWQIVYGRSRVGGTIIYLNEFGTDNKWLDIVVVLAAHPCLSVDSLLLDNQRIQIDPNTNCSFEPLNAGSTSYTIDSPNDITRVGNVVTIHLNHDIPL